MSETCPAHTTGGPACARSLGLLVRFAVLAAMLGLLGCVGEPEAGPLWADPGVVRLSPSHTRARVEIHNRSGTVRPIGDFALRGDDWDTLRFVDESLPRTIPGRDSVVVELEVSAGSFRSEPGSYRSGAAELRFASDQFDYELPIEFVGTDAERAPTGQLLLGTLALLALVSFVARDPLRAGLRARPNPDTPMATRAGVAAGFAALLLAAAAIPVGLGMCRGRLGAPVGPRELAQCRETLGGTELLALPASPGIWWWLLALAVAAAMLAVVRARSRSDTRVDAPLLALAGLRVLGFALLLAAMVAGIAPDDSSTSALVLAQADSTRLAGLTLPSWGIVAEPLGFVLAFALLGAVPLERGREPIVAALERLEQLVWSALVVAIFLGGPAVPGFTLRPVPLLTHAPTMLVELLAFGLKLALVVVLADRLRAHFAARELSPARALRAHARWTIPLALLNLAALLAWRAW